MNDAAEKTIDLEWSAEDETPCPRCGSKHLHHGYGFAAGPLGGYSICLDCNGPAFNVTPDRTEEVESP